MFVVNRSEWAGNATELLAELEEIVGEKTRIAKTWPANARALSGRLRRAASFLRKIGIDLSFEREGSKRTRVIRISVAAPENGVSAPSFVSASRVPRQETPRIEDGADSADANAAHKSAVCNEQAAAKVFYSAAELRLLVGKPPEELQAIHSVKQVFDGEIISPSNGDGAS